MQIEWGVGLQLVSFVVERQCNNKKGKWRMNVMRFQSSGTQSFFHVSPFENSTPSCSVEADKPHIIWINRADHPQNLSMSDSPYKV